VETEPFHRPVYQNQYVRILDVSFPPGQTTLLHTHSHDYAAVHLSDTTLQIQLVGKDWAPGNPVHFGEVQMNLFAGKPLTHRVRNVGTAKFHVMVFEILQ
jgi:quercetin dioxygenase-like cupin family protein